MAAGSSRCLFAGYRYESPLAGFENWSSTVPAVMTATHRQQGQNFAGLYYTLHRHYDPVLMRFTSPDPAASPFFNLSAYVGNNPAGFFDPDGLARARKWSSKTFTADLINAGLDVFEGMLTKTFGGGAAVVASGSQMLDGTHIGDTFVGQGLQEMGRRHDARSAQNGGGLWGYLNGAGGTVSDTFGFTGISESVSGRDNITGRQLTGHERYERGVDGASSLLLTTAMIAAPKVVPWAASVGSGARVGGGVTLPMFRRMTPELAPGPHRAQIQYLKAMRRDVPKAPSLYRRPVGATTRAQRASVQGRPCVECGKVFPRMIADHINPLVVEWYETGTINLVVMRSLLAVQSHCPKCSPAQGATLRQYSLAMRAHMKQFGRAK